MEKITRKSILIDLVASLLGVALILHTLFTLKDPAPLRWIVNILGLGVFLYNCFRYGFRLQQTTRRQKV